MRLPSLPVLPDNDPGNFRSLAGKILPYFRLYEPTLNRRPVIYFAVCSALATLSACALPPSRYKLPPVLRPDGRATQSGIASWYGPGFHGQATASGSIYNQNELTAAHQTLPMGTRLMVTNLNNGRAVQVLVNDRGPFVEGRIIDLSYAAARSIDMIGPGTAPVRIEVLEAPFTIQFIRTSLDYTLQLGSFSQLENAEQLRDRLLPSYSDVAIVPLQSSNRAYYRVQLGTFSNRAEAEQQARRLAQNGYSVLIMEK
ncbi:MAG TPA: septal ring lytic transglycosylase RlpA family protein [Candidatus Binatia bacterium]|nr:septal ring lytic transglycosylase RlpA family protein [Candidatus Binatia bacterium]